MILVKIPGIDNNGFCNFIMLLVKIPGIDNNGYWLLYYDISGIFQEKITLVGILCTSLLQSSMGGVAF